MLMNKTQLLTCIQQVGLSSWLASQAGASEKRRLGLVGYKANA
jgi:hypothetical protein